MWQCWDCPSCDLRKGIAAFLSRSLYLVNSPYHNCEKCWHTAILVFLMSALCQLPIPGVSALLLTPATEYQSYPTVNNTYKSTNKMSKKLEGKHGVTTLSTRLSVGHQLQLICRCFESEECRNCRFVFGFVIGAWKQHIYAKPRGSGIDCEVDVQEYVLCSPASPRREARGRRECHCRGSRHRLDQRGLVPP
jgi:hypothetical protein